MKKSFLVSLTVLLMLTVWMFSGQIFATHIDSKVEIEIPTIKKSNRLMSVRVQTPQSEDVMREVVIQGQIEPWQTVLVAAETAGVVSKIQVKKGQRVKAGELLLELNMDERDARLREALAQLKLRKTEHEGVIKLQKNGLQSKTDLVAAAAKLEASRAVLQQVELDIEHTRLRAPFAGVINDKLIELGDFLDRGNPAILLVNDTRLLAVGNVPQQSIRYVHPGLSTRVKLITGEELQGQVSFVSTTADAATRSFRIEVAIDNQQQHVVSGISSEIIISVEKLSGHFLSPAMLALNDSGELGVKAVDTSDHVVFHSVNIIRTTQKGAWVTGLPDSVRIITLGQGFVRAGDEVKAVSEMVSDDGPKKLSRLTSPTFPDVNSPDTNKRG